MRPAARPRPAVAAGVRDLFVAAYPRFAPTCRAVDEPGLAIVAIHERTGRAAGICKLLARVGRPVAAIVGRHDHCDLYLTGSESLALRHLAIVLGPVESWAAGAPKLHYRVLDLRTSGGMTDEEGRVLRGLRAEGPAVLRCAGYVLFVLPLGDPTDWLAEPADAWAALPERVYFDELDASPAGSLPQLRLPRRDLRQSVIFRTLGPCDTADPGSRLGGDGDLAGKLELAGPHRQLTISIGHAALQNGVLLGRYARCDASDGVDDESLSRVHALLLQFDDRLLAIDTASTNGTRIPRESRARVIEIDRDLELLLGKKTTLRWRWVG
jgi:hypothetical protein